ALTLTAVQADRDGHSLHLAFADGTEFTVDLQPIIERHPSLRSLGAAATFGRAKLGPWGATVTWGTDALELAANNLRALASQRKAS
ncbi:DUF2442 domain-containing protein, partial [Pseudacidovorax intermedius]|uniref:DUF2442 domain-containing protein n=1 Tax=Pseudacidovorax intermedius TaxID=433924 RepID=UPI001FA76FB7